MLFLKLFSSGKQSNSLDEKKIKKEIRFILNKADALRPAFTKYIKENMAKGLSYDIGPTKTFARSFEKVIKEKGGNVSRLKDSYRGAIYFDTLEQLYSFIDRLVKYQNKDFEIIHIEDSFYPIVVSGNIKIHHAQAELTSRLYRDIKIIVNSKKWNIPGEIQLHFNQYVTVKDETYRLYGKEREYISQLKQGFLNDGRNIRIFRKMMRYKKQTIALNELAIIKYNLISKDIEFMKTKDVVYLYMKKNKITDYDYALYEIIVSRTVKELKFRKNFYLKQFYKYDLDFIKAVIS